MRSPAEALRRRAEERERDRAIAKRIDPAEARTVAIEVDGDDLEFEMLASEEAWAAAARRGPIDITLLASAISRSEVKLVAVPDLAAYRKKPDNPEASAP